MPENVCLPNMPSLTSPEIVSPSTVPENSSVIGMGREIDDFQLMLLPETVPSSIGWPWLEPALCVPVSVAPKEEITSVLSCAPTGVGTLSFHVPSTAISRSPQNLRRLSIAPLRNLPQALEPGDEVGLQIVHVFQADMETQQRSF